MAAPAAPASSATLTPLAGVATLPAESERRNLRWSYADGFFYSLMVGFGETYLPAFALAVGLGEVTAGLLTSIPLLAGGLLQLLSQRGLSITKSYRQWVVFCAVVQGLSYVPLAFAAWSGTIDAWVVFALAAVYWGFGMAAGPMWNNWIDETIPKRLLNGFLARRSRLTQLATFLAFLAGGCILNAGQTSGRLLPAFVVLFALAFACRLASASFLGAQDDAPEPPPCRIPWRQVVRRFREPASSRFLLFLLVHQVSVNVASPFFSPFMLGHVKFSYFDYVAIISASYLTKIALFPVIAKIVERLTPYRTLLVSGIIVAPLPLAWLLSDSFIALCAAQIIGGFAWGCFELASMLLIFHRIAPAERLRILVLYNVMNATCVVVGSLVGGAMLSGIGGIEAYRAIFALSTAARLMALVVLLRGTGMRVRARRLFVRTIALRPGNGSLQAPILTSDYDAASERSTALLTRNE